MINLTPITMIPPEIQQDWMSALQKATPAPAGMFQVTDIKKTNPAGWQSQRVIVQVVDEEGRPLPAVRVAFSYSTAKAIQWQEMYPEAEWKWAPPPMSAVVVETEGSGMIDFIQGSAVKPGQPGGMTVYILEPEYSSDIVTGAGMLADHTGLMITFKLSRSGYVDMTTRINNLEERVRQLEER